MRRLQEIRGVNIRVHDGPGGRVFMRAEVEDVDDEDEEMFDVQLYDVVTIGGWSMSVPQAGLPNNVETVNDFWHEQNHILLEGATVGQVNNGAWAWGRGDSQTHFAIAAIVHGTRDDIPQFEAHWWNLIVPAEILRARAVGENNTGGPIKLTLTIGQIGG